MTITREQIIAWAKQAGLYSGNPRTPGTENMIVRRVEAFAALIEQAVRADENEQCAKVCEERKIITPEWQLDQHYNQAATHCAAAIRARREKE